MTTAFRSHRHPYDWTGAGLAPVRIWEATTPFGHVALEQAQAPLRAIVTGQGIPTVALVASDPPGSLPAMRTFREVAFPLRLDVDGQTGTVDQPSARTWSLQLTRASRRIVARVGDRAWETRSTGLSGRIDLVRDGVLVLRSSGGFHRHEPTPHCTPEDLAVGVALSPLRGQLSVLLNVG